MEHVHVLLLPDGGDGDQVGDDGDHGEQHVNDDHDATLLLL